METSIDNNCKDVISQIRDLEHRFRQIHASLLTELPVENKGIPVKKLLHSLTLLSLTSSAMAFSITSLMCSEVML